MYVNSQKNISAWYFGERKSKKLPVLLKVIDKIKKYKCRKAGIFTHYSS